MEFKKYQHLERFGTQSTHGITDGRVFVFPKIDGTNSSVYLRDGEIKAGSRNRELTLENDNAGFYNQIIKDEQILAYLQKHPTHRLYGEFLVPHSLKTYNDDAWRKFYIFDVCIDADTVDGVEYIPYEIYQPMLEEFALNYIPPICIINNASMNDLSSEKIVSLLEKNTYLIKEMSGMGEGITIKNYDYRNKYGNVVWAKIVSNEFKAIHHKTMGAPEINTQESVEQKIVDRFCTEAFIEKEHAKLLNENDGLWTSKLIPMFLGKVWHELIAEESWNIIKKFKNPTIDYRRLNALVVNKIKNTKSEIF